MNDFDKILADLDVEIDEIDLYGYGIIETSFSMVHRLQTVLNDLREKIQTYVFPSKEDEILFFKTQKPEILVRSSRISLSDREVLSAFCSSKISLI